MSNVMVGNMLFGVVGVVVIGLAVLIGIIGFDKLYNTKNEFNEITNLNLLNEYDYIERIYEAATYARFSFELLENTDRVVNLRLLCLELMCRGRGNSMTNAILSKVSKLEDDYINLVKYQSKYAPSDDEIQKYLDIKSANVQLNDIIA
jgi:hypothetical protein|uniref:Uncharacterized protein n=1 Tax=Myoviridae sp. ctkfK18 TaxID=2825165 RepID=A0A8S5VH40_9CAUD|nr:MAG TPA: hypothetical protein [Myoviridae sp. ctkfK18]